MSTQLLSKEKAKELVNMYYSHSRTQRDAIALADEAVYNSICQKIDSLHCHVFHKKDFDSDLIKSQIQQLKWWQEVACELSALKQALSII